jgi:hypothetical protein
MLTLTFASKKLAAQNPELNLSLRNLSQQRSYTLKDSIVLNFEIINSSHHPVGVFARLGMGYQGGFILHLIDSAGAAVEPPVLPHDTVDLQAVQDERNYFHLRPAQFFGMRQSFLLSELVSKPGHYKLIAEYHCPIDSKYAKIKDFWDIERKSIISSELDLTVE